METELNYSDKKIKEIDNELLNLFYASQKKSKYQFFDFYEALKKFNEYALKEGDRKEYFIKKAYHFRGVFFDLMFNEGKASWCKYISYDPNSRIVETEVTAVIDGERKKSNEKHKIDKELQHNYLKENIKNLKQSIPESYSVNKYNYLLEDCQIITGANDNLSAWEKNFKTGFDALFDNYNLDIRQKMTFDKYVKELQSEKKLFQETNPSNRTFKELQSEKKLFQETNPSNRTLTGFQCSLRDEQINRLYRLMQGNYFDGTPDNFKAIFKDEPLPPDCSIQWIDKGKTRHEPNKQTLFEFLFLLKEYKYLDKSNFDTTPTNRNNLYRKLETIFPDIKNFSASNPQALQNKTLRQKELKTIISALQS